ncbi:MAG TPA: SRPBCC family protein [Actinomycetota bacterium]|nr:SRPBCC family protein [Actinomycetota bacterium]
MTIDVNAFAETDIDAPIDVVFRYRLDGDNIPLYNPHTANIRRTAGEGSPGPGAEWRFDLTLEGLGTFESFHRVAEAEEPKRIVIETGDPPLIAREENVFSPTPGGGTHVEFRLHVSVPDEAKDGVPLFEQLSRQQIEMELANIKRNLERGEPGAR